MVHKHRERNVVFVVAVAIALMLGFVAGHLVGVNSPSDDKNLLPEADLRAGLSTGTVPDIDDEIVASPQAAFPEAVSPDTASPVTASPNTVSPDVTESSVPVDEEHNVEPAGGDDDYNDIADNGDGEGSQADVNSQESGQLFTGTSEHEGSRISIGSELESDIAQSEPASIRQTFRLDVPSYNQMDLGYPLGCELVALAMMMNYEHSVDIYDLYMDLPRADLPYEGFRGDPATSTSGWTVFPPALSGMMIKYIGSSYDMSGLEMDDLIAQLNTDTPILVWIKGLGWPVHALCLTGYDEYGFFYNDPATGEKDVHISFDDFYQIWNEPIVDRVLGLTYTPRKALSYIKDRR